MSEQTTGEVLRPMLIRGGIVWTILFVIAVFLVAKPFIEEFRNIGFGAPSLAQIVLPTLLSGLLVAGIWIAVGGRILQRPLVRAWLAYLVAGLGSFLTMVPVIAFVAMPDALWQLVSIFGVTAAVLAAIRIGQTRVP